MGNVGWIPTGSTSENQQPHGSMSNFLSKEKRAQILSCLVEGNSMRSTSRLVGVSINTVTSLLVQAGRACSNFQDKAFRELGCKRVQCDEVWSFIGAETDESAA